MAYYETITLRKMSGTRTIV